MENEDIVEPGTELFGYRVLEFVGEGGWAYVYKARHPKLPKFVAIKQLKPEWAEDEGALQRFLREANIVARLNHPNVVTVYDLRHDTDAGLHYIVTEFAEKGTLADRLEESPGGLPIDEVLHIAMGICSGLEAVHRRGVVHRDIKPTNILMIDVGEGRDIPKLTDFGIAEAPALAGVDAGVEVPESSGVYGTLLYMSPEQLDEKIDIDHRSDLYSLGVLLYELLTGQVPFTGEVQNVFWAHMYVSPKPPNELRPDIPEPLAQVVLRALAKDCRNRYQSAADMHEALGAIEDIEVRKERQRRFKALLRQGLAHLEREEWDAAIEALRRADVLEPGNERVLEGLREARDQQELKRLYDRGIQYLDEGNWEEAHDYLARVMAYDPDYAGGRAGEQLERATEALERELRRRILLARYRTGMGHFRKWQWAGALEELGWVVAQDPDFEDAADRLAQAHEYVHAGHLFKQAQYHRERGEWKRVIDLLEEVGLVRPPHIDVTQELREARKKWAEARRERELAACYDEAVAHLEAGNLERAREAFETIRERQPDYRDVVDRLREADRQIRLRRLFERASEDESARDWGRAIGAYRGILEIDPHNRRATHCLARAQRRADRRARRATGGLRSRLKAARRDLERRLEAFRKVPGLSRHRKDATAGLGGSEAGSTKPVKRGELSPPARFSWMGHPIVALIAGGLCVFLVAWLARGTLASLDPMRRILSIVFLLLVFVPLSLVIQWAVAQRAKARDDPSTDR